MHAEVVEDLIRGWTMQVHVDLVLVDRWVNVWVEDHVRCIAILLVIIGRVVITGVVGIVGVVRCPVIGVITRGLVVPRACTNHGIQIRLDAVEHRRRG